MGTAVLADQPPATSERRAFMTNGPDFGTHPGYFQQRQRLAWERFQALPAPTRKDENWRFADVKQIDISAFHRAERISANEEAALVARSTAMPESASQLLLLIRS